MSPSHRYYKAQTEWVTPLSGYLLLGMLEGFGLRAIRDVLPGNPIAQERLAGTILTAMAIADVRASVLDPH